MRVRAMENQSLEGRSGERGFALVLAILSLMLLTFLGLTMATTTSTELQIATNYRWSQQALYNAEAGLEAARVVLSRTADVTNQWNPVLPAVRTSPASWVPGAAPLPVEPVVGRDFYRSDCDQRGGMGYGRVLTEGALRYENQSVFDGHALNGAFTIWVRRGLVVDNAGQYSDDGTRQDALIVVAEGVAPYTGAGDAFTRARQAVRVLEAPLTLSLANVGDPCLGAYAGQEGGSPFGENFYGGCGRMLGGQSGSLGAAIVGPGTGSLAATGAR
jgi:hypothetical protein